MSDILEVKVTLEDMRNDVVRVFGMSGDPGDSLRGRKMGPVGQEQPMSGQDNRHLIPGRSAQLRATILERAGDAVLQDRNLDYGDPEDNFQDVAELWATYLGRPIGAKDVAAMMILVKVARLRKTPYKVDHWVDIAGYAACGGSLAELDLEAFPT